MSDQHLGRHCGSNGMEGVEVSRAEETMVHVRNPRSGGVYTEMYSHFLQVVEVGKYTGILCATWRPPCTVPDDNQYMLFPSSDAFEYYMSYDSPSMGGKSWMSYTGCKEDLLPTPEMVAEAQRAGRVRVVTEIWGKPWPRPLVEGAL